MPEKLIRKAIRYGLHETIQDKLGLKGDDYHLVSDEIFNKYLDTIDYKKMRSRDTQKISREKLKSSYVSNDDSHASSGIIMKKAKKEVKKTSQGEARFLSLCKISGMLYSK